MPEANIKSIVRFGLEHERLRMEVASHNLAMANVALTSNAAVPLKTVRVNNAFSSFSAPQAVTESLTASADSTLTKQVHDPVHPLADGAGMVLYPNVEPAREMATLVAATRAYEANVRAYNLLRSMSAKGLEIGGRQ